MEKQKLVALANKNRTTKALFKHFATRDRNPKEGMMDLRRAKSALVKQGVEVIPNEFQGAFKALEAAGLGKLIKGDSTKGIPPRFKWLENMKEVAQVALENKGEEEESPSRSSKVLIQGLKAKSGGSTNTDVVIMLGPNREASVSFPVDLTEDEVDFICNMLRSKASK